MPVMQACAKDDPLLLAWEEYRKTEDYRNSFKWAADLEHRPGSMWAVFMEGWLAATERAATLHESVNPASDNERQNKVPGAGGMGAVIEYRDLIRKRGGLNLGSEYAQYPRDLRKNVAGMILDSKLGTETPPPVHASDVDPTAGLNPNFAWDGKDE